MKGAGGGTTSTVGVVGYGQFCPVSKAAEVLGPRWALLVVRELVCGSARFGDIQRGVPGCPPATLSKRLKELVAAGVAERVTEGREVTYRLTEAGQELLPIIDALGVWGHRWVRSRYGDDDLDVDLLLWDVRRHLDPAGLGADRAVVALEVRTPAGRRRYWIVVEGGAVDLCLVDPERSVDVVVDADLRALTQVWMGDATFAGAVRDGTISVAGDRALARRVPGWLGRHPVLGDVAPARSA